MIFHFDVSFVPNHDALKTKTPATIHRVAVQAPDRTAGSLLACQLVAARGVFVTGSRQHA